MLIKKYSLFSISIVTLLLLMSIIYGIGKDLNQGDRRGDSAIFEQVINNIKNGKGAVSNVFANTQNYIEHYAGKTPKMLIEEGTLSGPISQERDMLQFHAYYVLYPISLFASTIKSSLLLSLIQSFSFFGLLIAVYIFIVSKTASRTAAIILISIIALNPNWYGGIQGLFYPDRLFILFGFLFCWAIYENKSWLTMLIFSFLLIIINERAALIGGIVVLLYMLPFRFSKQFSLLPWKFILLAIALLLYSYIAKTFILDNLYYSSFLPTSAVDLYNQFKIPGFSNKISINLINNAPLILLALFVPRYALTAFFILSINIVGNIGGAEKIGWTTHYHTYYFPILVFAATVGFVKFIKICVNMRIIIPSTLAIISSFLLIIGLYVLQDRFNLNGIGVRPSEIFNRPNSAIHNWYEGKETGYSINEKVKKHIKDDAIVNTDEFGMAVLHDYSRISVFPIDIDKADYLFIPSSILKEVVFSKQDGTEILLSEWIEMKGFDINNIIIINISDYCIIKRSTNSSNY